VFFGRGRFWQRATEKRIDHMGIALSEEWMIQSSSSYGGVSVAPLFTPPRARAFSWARRL
jgi:cell wall-associated NlpC family hydrolase